MNLAGAVSLELVTRVQTAMARASGLDTVATTALTALANVADGCSIDVLRGLVGLSQPGCARLVDRLAGAGLVQRDRSSTDRRVVAVRLTAGGRAALQDALAARERVLSQQLAGLSDDRARTLESLLGELAAASVHRPPDANAFCRSCDPAACSAREACPVTVRAYELADQRALPESMRGA